MSYVLALTFVLAAAGPRTFTVDPAASRVTIQVGRAGLFGFAGHDHEVQAPIHEGRVVLDAEEPARSAVAVSFRSADLQVTGQGEPAKDVPRVQEVMQGPRVLDASRYPAINFEGHKIVVKPVSAGAWEVAATGDLTLRGVRRTLTVPMRVVVDGDVLTAVGRTTLRHDWFGLEPVSAGGGTVKVRNEIVVDLRVLARGKGPAAP